MLNVVFFVKRDKIIERLRMRRCGRGKESDYAIIRGDSQSFSKRHFAMDATGIVIDSAEPGKAVCSLTLEERHMNENHVPMGGAVFTLADFTCAIAANGYSERKTVSQHASITFLSPARGKRLIAEAVSLRDGRTTALYTVDVRDELGTYVAHGTINGYVLG